MGLFQKVAPSDSHFPFSTLRSDISSARFPQTAPNSVPSGLVQDS